MLALVASEKKYVSNLLDKFNYKKEYSKNCITVYKCDYKNHEFLIVTTGYGKINIGSSLMYLLCNYDIRVLVSVGTAGSISNNNDIFSCIIPNNTLQFDVDFMPNGYKEAMIPLLDNSLYKANDDLVLCANEACMKCMVNYSNDIITSSDMYVSNNSLANSIRSSYNAGAVDCESACVGEFSYINKIAYVSIKVVSNYANNNGIKQYNLYDDEASVIDQKIVYRFIQNYYE
ncbi:MAG: 5'-methylthioadenosine/S-adenosylhomocysteine nucleosidase [Tenericutes bacterium]|nr:5'-methylthioadenosine/S-adenosylhomocysteine nucleosidase [Mycoplasmatota bacterium]